MNRKSRSLLGLQYGSRQSLADQCHRWQVPVLGQRRSGQENQWARESRPASSLPRGRSQTIPRCPRPERTRLVFLRVKESLRECIDSVAARSSTVSAQPSASNSLNLRTVTDTEAAVKRIKVLLSKIEELEERYSLFMRLWEGVRTMSQAYVLHGGSNLKASLESVHAGCLECVQTLCIIEANLESLLGTFHFTLQGLSGFSRMMPGDVFEISVRYGPNKWKSKCKISSDQQQICQPGSLDVTALLVEPLCVRVQELRCLGKGPLLGEKICDTIDLFKTQLQAVTLNLTPSGSLKLDMMVQWRPVEDFSVEIPSSLSDSALHRVHNLSVYTSSTFVTPDSKLHGHDSSRYSLPVGTSSSYLTPPPDFIPSFLSQSIDPSPAQSIASDSVSRSTYREHSISHASPSRTAVSCSSGTPRRTQVETGTSSRTQAETGTPGQAQVEVHLSGAYPSGTQVETHASNTVSEAYPSGTRTEARHSDILAVASSLATWSEGSPTDTSTSSDGISNRSQVVPGVISLDQSHNENNLKSIVEVNEGASSSHLQSPNYSPAENSQNLECIVESKATRDLINDCLNDNSVKDCALVCNTKNLSDRDDHTSANRVTNGASIRRDNIARDKNGNLFDNVRSDNSLASGRVIDISVTDGVATANVSSTNIHQKQEIKPKSTEALEYGSQERNLKNEMPKEASSEINRGLIESQAGHVDPKKTQSKSIRGRETVDHDSTDFPTFGIPDPLPLAECESVESDGHVTSAIDDALQAFNFLELDEYLMSAGYEELDEELNDEQLLDDNSNVNDYVLHRNGLLNSSVDLASSKLGISTAGLSTGFNLSSISEGIACSTSSKFDSIGHSTSSTTDSTDICVSPTKESINTGTNQASIKCSTSCTRDSTDYSADSIRDSTSTENSTDFSTTSTRHSTDISSNSSGYNSGFSTNSTIQTSTYFGTKSHEGQGNNSPDSDKPFNPLQKSLHLGRERAGSTLSSDDCDHLTTSFIGNKSVREPKSVSDDHRKSDTMQCAKYRTECDTIDKNDLNSALVKSERKLDKDKFEDGSNDLTTSFIYKDSDESPEQIMVIRL